MNAVTAATSQAEMTDRQLLQAMLDEIIESGPEFDEALRLAYKSATANADVMRWHKARSALAGISLIAARIKAGCCNHACNEGRDCPARKAGT